jgi:hypothetical protein
MVGRNGITRSRRINGGLDKMTAEQVLICISFLSFLLLLCWMFKQMDKAVNG